MTTDHGDGQGVVFRKDPGRYSVQSDGREIACVVSSHALKQSERSGAGVPAIGDRVKFIKSGDGSGVITELLPRASKFSRQAVTPGSHLFEQVIAANVDQVMPVFAAASPPPKWGLLDRYLVACEAAELPAVICITKIDLARNEEELGVVLADYRRIGYETLLVSVLTGQGLDELKRSLAGRVTVLAGKSGVGKTSLLNALQPGLGRRVREVSHGKQGKGLHTTTALEMFPLDDGGAVIDTPGVREFGLWDVMDEELALFFPEMRALVGSCRFGLDCRHDEEPGCSIRKAVMAGTISPYRYRSYLKLRGTS